MEPGDGYRSPGQVRRDQAEAAEEALAARALAVEQAVAERDRRAARIEEDLDRLRSNGLPEATAVEVIRRVSRWERIRGIEGDHVISDKEGRPAYVVERLTAGYVLPKIHRVRHHRTAGPTGESDDPPWDTLHSVVVTRDGQMARSALDAYGHLGEPHILARGCVSVLADDLGPLPASQELADALTSLVERHCSA